MALTKAHNRMIAGAPVNVLDFGATGNGTDETTKIQEAANAAKANNVSLIFNANGPSTVYLCSGVDVAGLTVISDSGVSIGIPSVTSDSHILYCIGTVGSPITTRTKIIGLNFIGSALPVGAVKLIYANDIIIENCTASGFLVTSGPNVFWQVNCVNPLVSGCSINGGENGIAFESCNKATASNNTIINVFRDGVLFYTNPSSTTTTEAKSVGNTVGTFNQGDFDGRGGIQFYGVRDCSSVGDIVTDDANQTKDDTGGIRFRDCENFTCSGYTISNCLSGLVVNHIGDYTSAPHLITRTLGSIGAGSISNFGKFGIVSSSSVSENSVSITGAHIFNGPDISVVSGSAGINHSTEGSVAGCVFRDMLCSGVSASGQVTITGNAFYRVGKGAFAVASIAVSGTASVSSNFFQDDQGSPTATYAIRVLSGGDATIGSNTYSTGVTHSTEFSSGSTMSGGTFALFRFGGVPTFSGVAINVAGLKLATNSGGVPYSYSGGAWNAL